MRKIRFYFSFAIILGFVMSCSNQATRSDIERTVAKPDIYPVFSVPAGTFAREGSQDVPLVLRGFPFLSTQPVLNFRGKFPPEFYARQKYRWRAESIKTVDFWSLRNNPYLYDVIYINPLWCGELQLRGDDLLDSISYSFNISQEQKMILKDWINQGGVLWMEAAVYISAYDSSLGKWDENKINDYLQSLKNMKFFDAGLNVSILKAQKTDAFHTEKVTKELNFPAGHEGGELKDMNESIRRILLEQTDYIGIYLAIDGKSILKDSEATYASYLEYGKGKVVTLAPFEFRNVHYDGELFRLLLQSWAMGGR